MSTYSEMVRQAQARRAELVGEIDAARRRIAVCEGEIDVLDQVVSALNTVNGGSAPSKKAAAAVAAIVAEAAPAADPAPKTRRKGGRRKKAAGRRGFSKWRPGGPGRPPKSWTDAQKAATAAAAPAAEAPVQRRRGGRRRKG